MKKHIGAIPFIFILISCNSEQKNTADTNTKVIDLIGGFVMPGIQENHVHASVASTSIDS